MVVHRRKQESSRVHFSTLVKGVIYGFFLAGWTYQEIADEVVKQDGTNPCQQSVASVVKSVQANGGMLYDGPDSDAGRPRSTSSNLDKQIVRLVFKNRGRVCVTSQYVQKVIKAARKVTARTIRRRLGEAGLAWLRRRRKSLVPAVHKQSRLDWAAWVLARNTVTLARWAYTDGTTFYLARSGTELSSKARGALGSFVWRQAGGHDALFEDCVGPSSYWKGQGQPIRVWGLLVVGMLFITVLPAGQAMNRWWYAWVIEKKFPSWLRTALKSKARKGVYLVQDHERALWTQEPRQAMRDQGIELLENYPKCSQDLNPIETAWREVRARLNVTMPTHHESRDQFICRLRSAVAWVNQHRKKYLLEICTSQKAWAKDVQDMTGGRTSH